MFDCKVVAHSKTPTGEELLSVLVTFPRIILAEVNTHRMLSKNTSSSRAIPFFKMLQTVYDMPFIPIAWQRHHSGMQGSEYVPVDTVILVPDYAYDFIQIIRDQAKEDKFKITKEFEQVLVHLEESFVRLFNSDNGLTIKELWLRTRDVVTTCATMLYSMGKVSKQICNRLLEPFMWTTMLITGNTKHGGWDNFFELRCPRYHVGNQKDFKSWKDLSSQFEENGDYSLLEYSDINRLKSNKGAAEIHIMKLAELVYDALNESTPKELKEGEWHIPFGDQMEVPAILELIGVNDNPISNNEYMEAAVKVSTAMSARTSYTIVGDEKEINYSNMIGLHDRLLAQNPPHSSPMEHCAKVMNEEEYNSNIKGQFEITHSEPEYEDLGEFPESAKGWCRNYKGFIPYRHIIESNTN